MDEIKYVIGNMFADVENKKEKRMVFIIWPARAPTSHKDVCRELGLYFVYSAGFVHYDKNGWKLTGKSESLNKPTTDKGKELVLKFNEDLSMSKIKIKSGEFEIPALVNTNVREFIFPIDDQILNKDIAKYLYNAVDSYY